jgi:hypothetical protein
MHIRFMDSPSLANAYSEVQIWISLFVSDVFLKIAGTENWGTENKKKKLFIIHNVVFAQKWKYKITA